FSNLVDNVGRRTSRSLEAELAHQHRCRVTRSEMNDGEVDDDHEEQDDGYLYEAANDINAHVLLFKPYVLARVNWAAGTIVGPGSLWRVEGMTTTRTGRRLFNMIVLALAFVSACAPAAPPAPQQNTQQSATITQAKPSAAQTLTIAWGFDPKILNVA